MEIQELELRDLPKADADELKAFVDKRRWFETRLKTLQDLPPIYPFVQLTQSENDTSAEGQWQLPSAEVLKQWRLERDRIELEVFAFDGGDLGRMKAKTREVTLIPLTPPSTHLISITLSTIVLVDKLLSLLRSRGETLELTAYRLEWNSLRTAVHVELQALEREANTLARDKARWRIDEQAHKVDKGRRTSLLDSPGALKLKPAPASSSSVAIPEAAASQMTPSKSLQLPLLHSHITNLRIRHRTLRATTLARAGTVLDKMIDKAAGLRGLGGLHGPERDKKTGGALPDEFLDVQDALDERATSLDGLIGVCEALEKQWREAATHQAACAAVEATADRLLDGISSATAMDDLAEFGRNLGRCMPPKSISTTLVIPTHADLPDLAEHNRATASTMQNAGERCRQALAKCKSALDARTALLQTREALRSVGAATGTVQMEVNAMGDWLRSCPDRPDLSNLSGLANDADTWQEALSNQRNSAEGIRVQAAKVTQQGVLALLRHKQIMTSTPDVVDQDLRHVVQKGSDALGPAVQILMQDLAAADQEAAVLRQARQVASAEERIAKEMQRLEETLLAAVEAAKWTEKPAAAKAESSVGTGVAEIQSSGLALQQEVLVPLDAVKTVIDSQSGLCRRLYEASHALETRHTRLQSLGGSLERLKRQKAAMQSAMVESVSLHSAISGLDTNLSEVSDDKLRAETGETRLPALEETLRALQEQIRDFVEGLAGRIPLVASKAGTDSSRSMSIIPRNQPTSPSPGPTQSTDDPDGLKEVDDRVRATVNELAVRLDSAVDQVQSRHIAVVQKLNNRRQLAEATRREQELVERIAQTSRFHRQRLEELETASHGGKQLSEDLDTLLTDVESDKVQFRRDADQLNRLRGLHPSDWTVPPPGREDVSQAMEALGDLVSEVREAGYAQNQDAAKGEATSAETSHTSSLLPREQACNMSPGQVRNLHSPSALDSDPLTADFGTVAPGQSTSNTKTHSAELRSRVISEFGLPDHLPELRQSDVFGPHDGSSPSVRSSTTIPSTFSINHDGISRQISRLRDQLDAVNLESVVYPTSNALRSTPSLRRLPTAAGAEKLKVALMNVSEEADDLVVPDEHREWDEYEALCDAVKARVALLPQLDHLVAFASATADCDAAMSNLLEQVDAYRPGALGEQVETSRNDAEGAIKHMEEASLMVESDSRVSQEHRRLQSSWTELQAVTLRVLHPEAAADDSDDGSSVATSYSLSRSISTMSIASQPPKKVPFPSRLPKSHSTRTVSNPLSASVTASTEASRSRAVSDRPAVSGLPRFRRDPITLSTIPGTPTRKRVESTSSIPRPVRTLASSPAPSLGHSPLASMRPLPSGVVSPMPMNKFQTLPRSRSKSGLDTINRPRVSAGRKPSAPKVYVSNPKNKLDVAVGKIVNRLKVDIPIAPVGLDWQDESGKYWIGAEGRAKLCFCRILRSRTVMVRVGGGWAELSRFLLDHFADEMVQLPAAIDLARAALSPVNEPKLLPSTPAPMRHNAPGTPAHPSPSKSGEGGGSPLSLVAMQLIRKASESPPVREKERERMWSPRKSLLG